MNNPTDHKPESDQPDLILLTGASSAGKSSLARTLQETLDGDWFHMGWDHFTRMRPAEDYHCPELIFAYAEVAKTLLEHDENIIMEGVFPALVVDLLKSRLRDHTVHVVSVTASPDVLHKREDSREDREANKPLLNEQITEIYNNLSYDQKIDTSAISPETAAHHIKQAVEGNGGGARGGPAARPDSRSP